MIIPFRILASSLFAFSATAPHKIAVSASKSDARAVFLDEFLDCGGACQIARISPLCAAIMAAKTITSRTNDARLDEWSPQLLKSRLYGQLLVDIIIGQLAPGERLDEQALAKRYGGGLAGIREALARLALEGLVLRRARVGTMVAPLDLMEAREAFEARALIEMECAGLAARNASAGRDRRHPRHPGWRRSGGRQE